MIKSGKISRTTIITAQTISLIGHPAIFVPTVIILLAIQRNFASLDNVLAVIGMATAVMLYSLYKARKGHWSHMDASVPKERHQLNIFLAALFFIGTVIAWWLKQPAIYYLGLAAAASIVAIALLSSQLPLTGRLKVSLHVSFALFATMLAWPNKPLTIALLFFAIAIGWSRLILSRHTMLDVVIGALVGAGIGIGYRLVVGL